MQYVLDWEELLEQWNNHVQAQGDIVCHQGTFSITNFQREPGYFLITTHV